ISMASGWGPKTRRSTAMARELEHVIGGIGLVEIVAQQNPARHVRAGHAMARVAERKQMMRKVAVRSDVRKPVRGPRVGGIPAVLGKDAGDVGIQRRQ